MSKLCQNTLKNAPKCIIIKKNTLPRRACMSPNTLTNTPYFPKKKYPPAPYLIIDFVLAPVQCMEIIRSMQAMRLSLPFTDTIAMFTRKCIIVEYFCVYHKF